MWLYHHEARGRLARHARPRRAARDGRRRGSTTAAPSPAPQGLSESLWVSLSLSLWVSLSLSAYLWVSLSLSISEPRVHRRSTPPCPSGISRTSFSPWYESCCESSISVWLQKMCGSTATAPLWWRGSFTICSLSLSLSLWVCLSVSAYLWVSLSLSISESEYLWAAGPPSQPPRPSGLSRTRHAFHLSTNNCVSLR